MNLLKITVHQNFLPALGAWLKSPGFGHLADRHEALTIGLFQTRPPLMARPQIFSGPAAILANPQIPWRAVNLLIAISKRRPLGGAVAQLREFIELICMAHWLLFPPDVIDVAIQRQASPLQFQFLSGGAEILSNSSDGSENTRKAQGRPRSSLSSRQSALELPGFVRRDRV